MTLKKKPTITTIYCDMDGVLTLWNYHIGRTYDEDVWKKIHYPLFIKQGGFEVLDMMPDGQMLVDFLDSRPCKVEVLSSSGGCTDKEYDLVKGQKLTWLNRYGITWSPIIVQGAIHKAEYATPHTLLIDDTERNTKDFVDHGGHAILHRNALETINDIAQNYILLGA